MNDGEIEPSEMDNDYELDKIKIKKSSDRLAKRARNCKYLFTILTLFLILKLSTPLNLVNKQTKMRPRPMKKPSKLLKSLKM